MLTSSVKLHSGNDRDALFLIKSFISSVALPVFRPIKYASETNKYNNNNNKQFYSLFLLTIFIPFALNTYFSYFVSSNQSRFSELIF